MGTLNKEFFSFDLDFLISETGKIFEGVSPSRIQGIQYSGALRTIEEGFEVEMSGREVELDSEIIINRSHHSEIPSKGSILKDPDNNLFKVFDTTGEDYGSVVRLRVVSKYASES
mgnify:CR=1 FL=1